MFWGLAVVCEEYFVPSLNILCEEFNIPDDVAGATFMAAGASSPEMFTSFIALFINHSAIGVGTVVGSEIFNHMIICSGSVLYSETGILQLEKYLFTRDVIGYIVALIALIWSLKSSFFHALAHIFDPDERKKCLDVTPVHAAGLVLVYVLYVIMSAYSQNFIRWINGETDLDVKELSPSEKEEINPLGTYLLSEKVDDFEPGANKEEDRMASMLASIVEADIAATAAKDSSIRQSAIQSVRSSTTVPPVLIHSYQLQRSSKYYPSLGKVSISSAKGGPGVRSDRLPAVDWTQSRATFVNDAPLYTWRSSGVRLEYLENPGQTFIRTEGKELYDQSKYRCFHGPSTEEIPVAAFSPHQYSAYLYCRVESKYFHYFMKWQLRYYTIDRWGFYSRKGRTSAPRGPHLRIVDLTDVNEIKIVPNSGLEFQLIYQDGKCLEFRAPTEEIRKHVIDRLQSHLATLHRLTAEGRAECHRIAK